MSTDTDQNISPNDLIKVLEEARGLKMRGDQLVTKGSMDDEFRDFKTKIDGLAGQFSQAAAYGFPQVTEKLTALNDERYADSVEIVIALASLANQDSFIGNIERGAPPAPNPWQN